MYMVIQKNSNSQKQYTEVLGVKGRDICNALYRSSERMKKEKEQ